MKIAAAISVLILMVTVAACTVFAFDMDVEFGGGGEGKVVFSHKHHTEVVKKKCNDCHTILFQRKAGSTQGITMAAMEGGGFCGACHNGDTAFDVKADNNCAKCHRK